MERKENPAKTFLGRYRALMIRRESLMRVIQQCMVQATDISVHLKDIHVMGSSPIHDQMAETTVSMADATARLDSLVKDIDKALSEILSAINIVQDETQRTILTLRYVEGLTWEQVCYKTHYERSWVNELHGLALTEINSWLTAYADTCTRV